MNIGVPPGLGNRALCTQVLPACWPMVSAPRLHRPPSSILRAHLTLKGTPVLAWLPGRLDYRITFSPPGEAMGNPLSSLPLDVNNQC